MKLGYTIIYVSDVQKTIAFYENAFGLAIKFLHESMAYGEMETGTTTLAFVAEDLSKQNGISFTPNLLKNTPPGIEIAFVIDNVTAAYNKAVHAGAQSIKEPMQKPWGQIVAYVRDINGILIELCSPLQ
ncbi:MAG: VOC family protein [Candidatus Babeliales bacterium]|jgi:predicted enzyme related to lactoylglutathione lyase